MKRLVVTIDPDFQEDLRELARSKKTSVAALVRYALDKTFEDELDEISSRRAYEDMLKHPEESMSLDDYLEKRGIALSGRDLKESPERPGKIAEGRGHYSV